MTSRFLLVVALAALLPTASPAQVSWETPQPPKKSTHLVEVGSRLFVNFGRDVTGLTWLYQSADSGRTWQTVANVGGSGGALAAGDGSLYRMVDNGSGDGLWRSDDLGSTWRQIRFDYPRSLGVTGRDVFLLEEPSDAAEALVASSDRGVTWVRRQTYANGMYSRVWSWPGEVFVRWRYSSAHAGYLLRSTDGGQTFSDYGPDTDLAVSDFLIDELGRRVLASNLGLQMRSNATAAWQPMTSQGLSIDPTQNSVHLARAPGVLFLGTIGGVFALRDGATSWQDLSAGLSSLNVTGIFATGAAVFAATEVGLQRRLIAAQPPAITITSGPSSGLTGQQLTFGATATNCTPAASGWTWGTDGGTVSGMPNGASIIVSWSAAGSKTLTASNSACGAAQGAKTVTIAPSTTRPTAGFAWSPNTPVRGQSVQFTDQSTASPTSWSWDFGDGGSTALQNPTHTFQHIGSFNVRLTASNSAGSNTLTHTVNVVAPGSGSITISGPTSGPILSPLEFGATATNCTPAPTGWRWTIDNQAPPLQYGGIYTSSAALGLASEGGHTVRATNSGCPGAQGARQVTGLPHERQTFELLTQDPISSSRNTIVLVHGLQEIGRTSDDLWTCLGGCDSANVVHGAGELLSPVTNVNKLQFTWSGAFQVDDVTERNEYIAGRAFAEEAGIALAGMLRDALGPNYNRKIQFVGHSLGTVVSANAAAWFLTQTTEVTEAQLTALDRPDHISVMPPYGHGGDFEESYGFDNSYFASVLAPAMRSGLTFKLDNYWALGGAGVGDTAQGFPQARVYNHRRPTSCPGCSASYDDGLDEPNDVGDYYFESEGVDNNHSGVHQWYRWTMAPNSIAASACSGATWNKPSLFHGSLNPCRNGFYWSLMGPSPASFPTAVEPDTAAVTTTPVSGSVSNRLPGSPDETSLELLVGPGAELSEASIDLPMGATALSFRLTPTSVTPTDTIVISLDGVVLWSGSAGTLQPGVATRIGPLQVHESRGAAQLRLQVFGGGSTHLALDNLEAVSVIPPCELSSTLCITDQRFRVEADWEDHHGNSGDAVPRYVGTDDSGFFWFFGEANLELVVKVIDACGFPGASRFWVFAAGLTDVGVRLKITDTWTGATRTYSNPRGTPFQPIQDIEAFATCGATAQFVAPGSGVITPTKPERLEAQTTEESEATPSNFLPSEAIAPHEQAVQTVVGSTLLLNNNRFAVDVSWRKFDGTTGVGTPISLSSDSGYFWFFGPDNIELVIKVIDACGFPGAPRYWVYAGGLTNVETTITVRDTEVPGAVKTYFNALGTGFQPILDSNAFATCSDGGSQTLALTVSTLGSGSGTVSSNPAGISCPGDCSQNFNAGTTVTLTPTANLGSSFLRWGGACSSAGSGSCTLSMTQALSVSAEFESPGGSGVLLSEDFNGGIPAGFVAYGGTVTATGGAVRLQGSCLAFPGSFSRSLGLAIDLDFKVDSGSIGDFNIWGLYDVVPNCQTGPSNGYYLGVYPVGSDNTADNLYRVSSGVGTLLDTNPTSFSAGQWHHLRYELSSSGQIRILIDGALTLSATNGSFSTGKFAVRGWGSFTWIDDLVVTTLP